LRLLAGGEYLVGVRHQVHDEADPRWLTRPDVLRGIAAVRDAGLTFDLLVRERELPAANTVVRRFPDLRFVLDHCAKPSLGSGEVSAGWAQGITLLAAAPNVFCKLSGLVTEANWAAWTIEDLRPAVAHAGARFGPARLLYGSDWPVCLLAASYERVERTARALVAELYADEGQQGAIFGANAQVAYHLPSTRALDRPAAES
jgi:L-fuconolactonase